MIKTIEIQGLRNAVRQLNKVEPGLRKQFNADVQRIAAPAVQAAQRGYDRVPLSGMERKWAESSRSGRKIFPFSVAKARRGVKAKVDASRKATSIIMIAQTDRGAAVFETAGRAHPNSLGKSLGFIRPGRTRIIGSAVYSKRREIEREMRQAAMVAVRRVERSI